jgi:hypothetical protein
VMIAAGPYQQFSSVTGIWSLLGHCENTCPKASFGMRVRCRMAMNTGAAKSWIRLGRWKATVKARTRMTYESFRIATRELCPLSADTA